MTQNIWLEHVLQPFFWGFLMTKYSFHLKRTNRTKKKKQHLEIFSWIEYSPLVSTVPRDYHYPEYVQIFMV